MTLYFADCTLCDWQSLSSREPTEAAQAGLEHLLRSHPALFHAQQVESIRVFTYQGLDLELVKPEKPEPKPEPAPHKPEPTKHKRS